MHDIHSGRCYCGAIAFEAVGEPFFCGHCHCESCRRASGSVMTNYAGFNVKQIKHNAGSPAQFSTEDGVTRSFCSQCGSPVAFQHNNAFDEYFVHLGLFDNLEAFTPGSHSFLEEKPNWLRADEHLPELGWDPDKGFDGNNTPR